MGAFQKDAEDTLASRRFSAIVSAWVKFSAAIDEQIAEYNDSPHGQEFPATSTTESGTLIVIRCNKGAKGHDSIKDQCSQIMVTASARMHGREVIIKCRIERWVKRMGGAISPLMESVKEFKFSLDKDGESLNLKSRTITPYEAAGDLLFEALRK